MARIRCIKPEFFTSAQVAECSTNARLLFVGMWCFCDDNGVHPAKVKQLKMEVFPGDPVDDASILELVDQLLNAGLIAEFQHGNQRYWFVTGWSKHQKIDKPSTKYPRPDDPESHHGTPARRDADRGCHDGDNANSTNGCLGANPQAGCRMSEVAHRL